MKSYLNYYAKAVGLWFKIQWRKLTNRNMDRALNNMLKEAEKLERTRKTIELEILAFVTSKNRNKSLTPHELEQLVLKKFESKVTKLKMRLIFNNGVPSVSRCIK